VKRRKAAKPRSKPVMVKLTDADRKYLADYLDTEYAKLHNGGVFDPKSETEELALDAPPKPAPAAAEGGAK
jgi:hypothetical protein